MEWFDDIQIDECSVQDFVEEIREELFAEEEDSDFFRNYLKSNTDY